MEIIISSLNIKSSVKKSNILTRADNSNISKTATPFKKQEERKKTIREKRQVENEKKNPKEAHPFQFANAMNSRLIGALALYG